MEAKDLMIDDWTACEGKNGKVKELREHKLLLKTENSVMIVYYNSVKPIPLTTEILEKNGFIIKEKWAQLGNFGDNPLIMWHFVDDPILGDYNTELEIHQNDTGKVHVRIPCKYVHELQHALRLCGIEKTIEL